MDGEGEHSSDEKSVCCWLMFRWVVGQNVLVVSVVVGLRYIPMFRWDGFLVIFKSRILTLWLFSRVRLSWVLLWIVLRYRCTLSDVVSVES